MPTFGMLIEVIHDYIGMNVLVWILYNYGENGLRNCEANIAK